MDEQLNPSNFDAVEDMPEKVEEPSSLSLLAGALGCGSAPADCSRGSTRVVPWWKFWDEENYTGDRSRHVTGPRSLPEEFSDPSSLFVQRSTPENPPSQLLQSSQMSSNVMLPERPTKQNPPESEVSANTVAEEEV